LTDVSNALCKFSAGESTALILILISIQIHF